MYQHPNPTFISFDKRNIAIFHLYKVSWVCDSTQYYYKYYYVCCFFWCVAAPIQNDLWIWSIKRWGQEMNHKKWKKIEQKFTGWTVKILRKLCNLMFPSSFGLLFIALIADRLKCARNDTYVCLRTKLVQFCSSFSSTRLTGFFYFCCVL